MVERRIAEEHSAAMIGFRQCLLAAPKNTLVELMTRVLAVMIPGKGYDARTRALLNHLKRRLNIGHGSFVQDIEENVLHQIQECSLKEDQDTSVQHSQARTSRKWLLAGIGAVAGGLAVGLTAGIAAPFVFPALASAVGLTSLATFFASAGGIATMGILFGAAGAGLTGYKVTRRFGDVSDFCFIPLQDQVQRMHAIIGVSGWLESEEDITTPWTVCQAYSEAYALRWEKDALLTLGRALASLITGTATSLAATEILKMTVAASAVTALMFPVALLQSGDWIDNPWSIGVSRARLAGQILADVLRKRVHGHRPIDLYGYSLGALVVLTCLEELSKDPEGCFGIIENVVLFGVPATVHPTIRWHKARCMVAGRFIHVYSKTDWILSFLDRGTALSFDEVAGINPIRAASNIESVDFSGLIKGHLDYREKLPELLALLNVT